MDMGELTDPAYFILLSLTEQKHGYLIMKTIEELTNNEITIGPASLYTTLKKLLKADLIQLVEETDDNKKPYVITELGYERLQQEVDRKRRLIAYAEKILAGGNVSK